MLQLKVFSYTTYNEPSIIIIRYVLIFSKGLMMSLVGGETFKTVLL